jgi:uncharacterized protein
MQNKFLKELGINNVVSIILIITVICFILQNFVEGFTNLFLVAKDDFINRPWTLLTSVFMHGSIFHIFFNMYVLFMFGGLLESKIGSKRFLLLYLISGIFASFISSLIYPAALGASGAIFGIMGTLIILMPNLKILLMFVIPMPLWIAGIVLILLDVFQIIPGIGHFAHLAGIAFGLIYGLYLKSKSKKFRRKFEKTTHLSEDEIQDFLRSGKI